MKILAVVGMLACAGCTDEGGIETRGVIQMRAEAPRRRVEASGTVNELRRLRDRAFCIASDAPGAPHQWVVSEWKKYLDTYRASKYTCLDCGETL